MEFSPYYNYFQVELKDFSLRSKQTYTFRGLTRKETDAFLEIFNSNNFELFGDTHSIPAYRYALKRCVKEELNWDEAPPGIMIALMGLIKKTSLTNQAIFHLAGDYLETPHGLSEVKCVMVIPGMSFTYLSNCDPLDYAKTILLGEQLYNKLYTETPPEVDNTPPKYGERKVETSVYKLGK